MPLIHGKSQKAFEKNIKTEMEHGKPMKQSLAIAYAVKRKAQHKAKGGYMEKEKTEAHENFMEHEAKETPEHEAAEHMAHGGYAKGGKINTDRSEESHKMSGHSGMTRLSAESGHEKGINVMGSSGRSGGISEAGYYHRSGQHGYKGGKETAKEIHKKTLHEMKGMKKPKLYAEGGYIGSYQDPEQPHYDADFADIDHDKEEMASGYVDHKHLAMGGYAKGGIIDKIMAKRAHHYSHGGVVANDTDMDFAKKEPAEYDYLVKEGGDSFHYTGANSGDYKSTHGEDMRKEEMIKKIMASRAKKDKMPYYP